MLWPPDCYQRATAYLTDPRGRLLVFDHIDAPAAGTQVPAGGIHPGEDSADAVVRELEEESGLVGAEIVRKLGEAWRRADVGNVPAGLEEQSTTRSTCDSTRRRPRTPGSGTSAAAATPSSTGSGSGG